MLRNLQLIFFVFFFHLGKDYILLFPFTFKSLAYGVIKIFEVYRFPIYTVHSIFFNLYKLFE